MQPGGRPDRAKRAKVAELRAAGWTLAAIGAEMGVTDAAVCIMLKATRAQAKADS
jgi:predicted transcriptional regulator